MLRRERAAPLLGRAHPATAHVGSVRVTIIKFCKQFGDRPKPHRIARAASNGGVEKGVDLEISQTTLQRLAKRRWCKPP